MRRVLKVLDANYSNSANALTLQAWLSRPSNFAVISDHWTVEAMKGPSNGLKHSLEPLASYTHKVIVLKLTRLNRQMHGKSKGLASRFIDEAATREFTQRVKAILSGTEEHPGGRLDDLFQEANALMDRARSVRQSAQSIVDDLGSDYSKDEREHLRSNAPYPQKLFDKVVHQIVKLTHIAMVRHVHLQKSSMRGEVYNSYIFRYMLCQFLNTLKIIGQGGQLSPSVDKVVNDDFDMTYVAYATFFDGLLSNDKNAQLIYAKALSALARIKDQTGRR
jgi:hypothetical protein